MFNFTVQTMKQLVQAIGRLVCFGLLCLQLTPATAQERLYAPGDSFRHCAQCPQMTVIPSGQVDVGDPHDFDEPDSPKRPSVSFQQPFAVATFETSQAQWDALMGSSDHKKADLPVTSVSWRMVQDYLQRLRDKTGKPYRLPSEAEWEYAARAGSNASYSFGDDISQLPRHAWIDSNAEGVVHPVGQLQPNAFGLYDMHGNVWEWTADCYTSNFSKLLSRKDSDELQTFCFRVIRGGSVLNFAKYATAFHRASLTQVNNSPNLGFRVVLSLP